MQNLIPFSEEKLAKLHKPRKGETRVGDIILCCEDNLEKTLKEEKPDYVILGIPESIGPLANYGRPGAENAFDAFLPAFLSMQSNRFFTPKKILIAGSIDTADLIKKSKKVKEVSDLGVIVSELDKIVESVLDKVFEINAVPLVIGGGHNNAYPIMQSAHKFLNKSCKLNIFNVDPHADLRETDYRHSGNPFSFALESGILNKYFVSAMHKPYNNEMMLQKMSGNKKQIKFDFLDKSYSFKKTIKKADRFFSDSEDKVLGFEFDMDSIANFPVSALTPMGLSVNQAAELVSRVCEQFNPIYFHLPEAAPSENATEKILTGKALAWLVYTFLNSRK
ncbi:MAG: hypothetical protein EA412_11695 [Chitinophagaceae bacterium]|nr:MAG: hypothetical protein EA412_11695 [Chitinophagaceae bacterium]